MDAAVRLVGKMQCPLGYKRDCMRVNKQCLAHHIEEKGEGKLQEEAKKPQEQDEKEKPTEMWDCTPPCIVVQTPLTPHSPGSPKSTNASPILKRRNQVMLEREERERKARDTLAMEINGKKNSVMPARICQNEISSPAEETIVGINLDDSDNNEDDGLDGFATPKGSLVERDRDCTALEISFPVDCFER